MGAQAPGTRLVADIGGTHARFARVGRGGALDALRTQLHVPEARATVAGVLGSHASFGNIGGKGWEWIALAYLAGGLWLLQQRIITWHVPLAFLGVLALIAGGFYVYCRMQTAPEDRNK